MIMLQASNILYILHNIIYTRTVYFTIKTQMFFSCDWLVIFLLILPNHILAQHDPPAGYDGKERDALHALKDGFNNHPLLHDNWTGLQCYMNEPPYWYGIQCLNGRVTGISLDGLDLTGKISYNALINLTELTSISFKNNQISGNLMDFSSNKYLNHVDLSENLLEGSITGSLVSLDFLESLHLQNNKLTGPIPWFNHTSLREFNVSNNNLSGEIPKTSRLQAFSFSSYAGNPGLCGSPSSIICKSDEATQATNKKKKKKFLRGSSLIALLVVVNVLALALVVSLCIYYYRRNMKKKMSLENDKKNNERVEVVRVDKEKQKLIFIDHGGSHFNLNDLLRASAEGLGKGNYGNSYKAILENGPAVVVKRLRDLKPLSKEEFSKQMRLLAQLKHPNLSPLIAYYYSKNEKLLVYKFAPNGNLFNRLHGGRGSPNRNPFKWSSRLSVARDVGRAMEYLHRNTNSQSAIPHGNLKSSNVILDENDVALVSDYGLTSLISSSVATQRMVSYKSPEYQNRRKITKRSDVWSYGGLLLELITGKVSTYSAPQGTNGVDLCTWVHRAVREEWTAEIFDLEIAIQRSASEGLLKLLQIAVRCCDKSPEKWPEMGDVVREIESIRIIDSEEDDDDLSLDRSYIDDLSVSISSSAAFGGEDRDHKSRG